MSDVPGSAGLKSAAGTTEPKPPFTPKPGVLFNKPLTKKARNTINNHVRNSIDATRKGGKIRIMSWNVKSFPYRRALIRAHNRGVSVRVLMSNGLAKHQSAGGDYNVLRRELAKHQKNRKKDMKSWIRACVASCRGTKGIAHVKFYTFSRAGKANDVVMVGSANMTEVAAGNQWNDMFTLVNKPGLYDWYQKIFRQASRDHRSHPPYRTYRVDRSMLAWVFPYLGKKAVGDPVTRILKQVSCRGVTGKAGVHRRTAIRIGQTAILDDRGVAIARQLKRLNDKGCNIRIAYTVLGPKIRRILTSSSGRGPVPARQIAQDFDGDCSFDRYLHMKDMTISGHYGKNTSAHFVYNGTQNWTEVSAYSDEAGFSFYSPPIERRYAAWINRLFENPPVNPHPGVTCDDVEAPVERRVNGEIVLGGAYREVELN
jgi:phosphatidylserine/phosphatidylglycerophosphate/cardiolipin synthase-like enzyme